MLHWLSTAFSTYILHPEHGNGYLWWSGAGAAVRDTLLMGAPLWALVVHHKRKDNRERRGAMNDQPFDMKPNE